MDIYFTKLIVTSNELQLHGSLAFYAWVRANDSNEAFHEIQYQIETYNCKVQCQELPLMPCSENVFKGNDRYLEQYHAAKTYGFANILAVSDKRDLEAVDDLINSPNGFDRGHFYKTRNWLNNKGRCLHFNRGQECDSIIKAHSIQRASSLEAIASDDNHVYEMSESLNKQGFVTLKKQGISRASVFKGFCKFHDDQVFKKVDTNLFDCSNEHLALYAYRSICREVFVKQNSLELFTRQLETFTVDSREKQLIKDVCLGTQYGYEALLRHKNHYDLMLKNQDYSELRWAIIEFDCVPDIAFSGVLYPEYDFSGLKLQDLLNITRGLSLITFCFAPMAEGWAAVFSWRTSDDKVCGKFVDSLLNNLNKSTAIFRLIVNCCENTAYAPRWVHSLSADQHKKMCEAFTLTARPTSPIRHDYLSEGLEGYVDWKVKKVNRK
ncbi:hypothetical protein HYO48_22635 [Vibrio parahaemolyticus]|nr:hypothetical protein [Vibrio parahaemolyticus]MBM4864813.1 hypothetical protein [Vibrio parahaemolyticus]